jgi:hypothetical protein
MKRYRRNTRMPVEKNPPGEQQLAGRQEEIRDEPTIITVAWRH